MINLLLALLAGVVAFALSSLAGTWTYGIVPALLVFPLAYFFLARRIGRKLEVVMKDVAVDLQNGKVAPARKKLEEARKLAPWQFLINQQINAQLGAIEYFSRNYKAARPLLKKAWARNWQAVGMLAALELRAKNKDTAIEQMEKAAKYGRKDPVMWALYAYVLLESGDRDQALSVLSQALKVLDGNTPLKDLKQAIANNRMKKFKWGKVFGQTWYSFWPEQIPKKQLMAAQQGQMRGRKSYPQPRR
jgi:tetratricopeptide (TPR) repeat protein